MRALASDMAWSSGLVGMAPSLLHPARVSRMYREQRQPASPSLRMLHINQHLPALSSTCRDRAPSDHSGCQWTLLSVTRRFDVPGRSAGDGARQDGAATLCPCSLERWSHELELKLEGTPPPSEKDAQSPHSIEEAPALTGPLTSAMSPTSTLADSLDVASHCQLQGLEPHSVNSHPTLASPRKIGQSITAPPGSEHSVSVAGSQRSHAELDTTHEKRPCSQSACALEVLEHVTDDCWQ